jgi:hypothetical protein
VVDVVFEDDSGLVDALMNVSLSAMSPVARLDLEVSDLPGMSLLRYGGYALRSSALRVRLTPASAP